MFRREQPHVTGVAFYCKDCERIVDAHQVGRKYVYSCNICRTKNVAFGTEKSIRSFFHFDEVLPDPKAPVAKPGAAPAAPAVGIAPVVSNPPVQPPANSAPVQAPTAPSQPPTHS